MNEKRSKTKNGHAGVEVNGEALQRLLDYIDEEQRKRCRRILSEARAEADGITGVAWRRAHEQVGNAVALEKQRRNREIERARAEVRARLRQTWFRLIRRQLDHAWEHLHKGLIGYWQASVENRREWLSATLNTATHALGPGLWHVEHPEDWAMVEGAPIFRNLKREYDMLEVHFEPSPQEAGFRVSCSDVSVSTTVDGLLARRSRIEGLWLAKLHQRNAMILPSLLDEDAAKNAKDAEARERANGSKRSEQGP